MQIIKLSIPFPRKSDKYNMVERPIPGLEPWMETRDYEIREVYRHGDICYRDVWSYAIRQGGVG